MKTNEFLIIYIVIMISAAAFLYLLDFITLDIIFFVAGGLGALLVFMLLYSVFNLKHLSISDYFEALMVMLFSSALIITIFLTILLGLQWIPTYFNSIYILLGSIMVTIIGLYINRRLEKEKESRKIKRIIYVVNNTIKTNKNTAETLLLNNWGGIKTNGLKKGFWDIFSSNIIDVDLDPEIVRNLVTIKEITYEINDLTILRNKLLDFLYRGMPIDMDLPDKYDDEELAELIQQNNVLKAELEKLVEKSTEYLDKYEDF